MPLKTENRKLKTLNGFSIIEALIAMAVFGVLAAGTLTLVFNPLTSGGNAAERQRAVFLAEEGIEAARAIRDDAWLNLTNDNHGVVRSGGKWTFSDSSDCSSDTAAATCPDKYSRVVTIAGVCRDASNNIVTAAPPCTSGNVLDPRTKKVTSTVTWSSIFGLAGKSVSSVAHLTDWDIFDWSQTTDVDFRAGTFDNTGVSTEGSLKLIKLAKPWNFHGGTTKKWTTVADFKGGSPTPVFTSTECIRQTDGLPCLNDGTDNTVDAKVRLASDSPWLVVTNPGTSFPHTLRSDFSGGTFTNTKCNPNSGLPCSGTASDDVSIEISGTMTAWRIAKTTERPSPDTATDHLFGIDLLGASPTDGFMVGAADKTFRWNKPTPGRWNLIMTPAADTQQWNAVSFERTPPVAGDLGTCTDSDSNPLVTRNTCGFAVGNGTPAATARWDGAAWVSELAPAGVNNLRGVYCIAENNCFAVGNAAAIIQWNGAVWVVSVITTPNVTDDLNAVDCRDGVTNDCFAVGNNGRILRLQANGTWAATTSGTTANLLGVRYIPGEPKAYAVGTGGTILRWDGTAWGAVTSPTGNTLRAVSFVSDTDGWAAGDSGTIVRCSGNCALSASWSSVLSPTSNQLNALESVAATDAWSTGNSGTIIRYATDALVASGTFDSAAIDSGGGATTVWNTLTNVSTVPSPGTSLTIETRTGNVTPPDGTWSSFSTLSGTNISSPTGRYLQYRLTLTSIDRVNTPSIQSTTTSFKPAMFGTWMVSATDGWAVGAAGTIFRWDGTNWSAPSSPTVNALRGVSMISAAEGYAVGDSGTIIRWNGTNWAALSGIPATTNTLHAVHARTATDIWAVGASDTILHCTTSCSSWSNWTTVSSGTTGKTLRGVSMFASNDGYAVGTVGTIIRWNGTTWLTQSSGTTNDLYAVHTRSSTDAWAVGASDTIVRWDGTSWCKAGDTGCIAASPTSGKTLRGVSVPSATDGWIVGDTGTLLRWDGSSWTTRTSPTTEQLNGVHFFDASNGLSVGNNGLTMRFKAGVVATGNYVSAVFDSGSAATTWDAAFWAESIPTGAVANVVLTRTGNTATPDGTWSAFANVNGNTPNDGDIQSPDGRFLQYRINFDLGTATEAPALLELSVLYNRITDNSLNSVDSLSTADIWAVGDTGTTIKYNGTSWSSQTSGTTLQLNGVHMCATNDVFAVGATGTILRWNGTAWAAETSGTVSALRGVHTISCTGQNAGFVIAVGDGVTNIRRRSCDGSPTPVCTWAAASINDAPTAGTNFLGVHFIGGTNTGWAVGSNGEIYKSVDAGLNWSRDCDTGTQTWNAVFAVAANDVWVVGNGDAIRHKTASADGCGSWQTVSSPTSGKDLRGVYFFSASDGWVVGNSGTILRWLGSSWDIYPSPTIKNLFDVDIPSATAGEGWIVGQTGRILKGPSASFPPIGTFLSSILDTDASATWKVIFPTFVLPFPSGTSGTLAVRSGTPNPTCSTPTWSAFTAETSDQNGVVITSSANQCLQYRVTLQTSDNSQSPAFDASTVTYRK